MASDDLDRVVPLGQLDDFTVAADDPDVRGWDVLASDGRKIGEVDELLVDPRAMKVRYLDVDVDDELRGAAGERHVLIPVGYARLDRDGDRVMVDALASADVGTIPTYDQGPLTREFETSLRDSFPREGGTAAAAPVDASAAAPAEDPFYASDAFDADRFYGRTGRGASPADPAGQLADDWKTRRVGQVGDL